jgi:radical SAM-linked protein
MFIQRIRIRFQKCGDLAAISHLDLMRVFERALRRTGLPLRMTEGFNPRPRLSFPAALGVGIEGLDEVMEFELADWVAPAEIERRFRAQSPAGLNLVSIELAEPHRAAVAREVTYRITPLPRLKDDARIAAPALAELLARAEISVERLRKAKHKRVNLRPLICSLERQGEDIVARFKAGPEGSAHPEEVLGALGFDLETRRGGFRIVRTQVLLAN